MNLQLDVLLTVRKVENVRDLVLTSEHDGAADAETLKAFAAFDLIIVGGGSYHMLPFAPGSAHAAKLLALTHQALMAGIAVFGDVPNPFASASCFRTRDAHKRAIVGVAGAVAVVPLRNRGASCRVRWVLSGRLASPEQTLC